MFLNGKWLFVKDHDDIGVRDNWFQKVPQNAFYVTVPSVWNISDAVGYEDGYAWYFKEFELAGINNKCVLLCFEAVNISCDVWLNGEYSGRHEGGYTPFKFEITKSSMQGKNFLAVRVEHDLNGHAVSKETWYYKYAGIWQDVYIRIQDKIYIDECIIRTDNTGKIHAFLNICSRNDISKNIDVITEIADRITKTEMIIHPGANNIVIEQFINDARLWDIDDPYLYNINIGVKEGERQLDNRTVRFGIREFCIKGNSFTLNGKRITIKGVLYQPNHAKNFIYPDDREDAAREVRMIKEAGFNLMRAHIKPAHPWTLDAADEQGLLIYEEPAIGWMNDPPGKKELIYERALSETRGMVLRDINRPSVVIWGILNEGGNKAWEFKQSLSEQIAKLDPDRLIIDDSPIGAGQRNIIDPVTQCILPHWSAHPYRPYPLSKKDFNDYMTFGKDEMLSIVTEYGFGGLNNISEVLKEYERLDLDKKRPDCRQYEILCTQLYSCFDKFRLYEIFEDVGALVRSSQKLQAAAAFDMTYTLRMNPKLSGYIYTQWNDAGFEMTAGLVDQWRKPKEAFYCFNTINRKLTITIYPETYSIFSGTGLKFNCHIINEDSVVIHTKVTIRILKDRLLCNELTEIIKTDGSNIQRLPQLEHLLEAIKLDPGYYTFEYDLLCDEFKAKPRFQLLVLKPLEKIPDVICYMSHGIDSALTGKINAWGYKEEDDANLIISKTYDAGLIREAQEGRTVLFLEMPDDAAQTLSEDIEINTDVYMLGHFCYLRNSLLAKDLPADGFMGSVYAQVLPRKRMKFMPRYSEGRTELCGIISNNFVVRNEKALTPGMLADGAAMGYDIVIFKDETNIDVNALVLSDPTGKGRVIYNLLNLCDGGEAPAIADKLMYNLILYASEN